MITLERAIYLRCKPRGEKIPFPPATRAFGCTHCSWLCLCTSCWFFFFFFFKVCFFYLHAVDNSFFFFLASQCEACAILVSQPRIKPAPPAVEAQIVNHWTAREVPILLVLAEGPADFSLLHFDNLYLTFGNVLKHPSLRAVLPDSSRLS